MSLTVFEARQRAQELINQAVQLWQGTVGADKLEGLEDDPVFKMLFSALSYQSSLLEAEIDRLKGGILEDLSDYLSPQKERGAMPATAVIETNLAQGVAEMEIDENLHFYLRQGEGEFIPLFRTKVVNVKNVAVTRLDGRRWKLELFFGEPIRDLSGFSFAIKGCDYKSLRIYTGSGSPLNVIYPWQTAELPFNRLFSADTLLFNQTQIYSPDNVCLDLFTRENTAVYTLKDYVLSSNKYTTVDSVELILEFIGIENDFVFDKTCFSANCIVMANVTVQNATLSRETPIVRTVGDNFLHLVPVSFRQNFSLSGISVKTHTAERFDSGSLLDLINVILAKLDTDKGAFSVYTNRKGDELAVQLRNILVALRRATEEADSEASCRGTYLMLKDSPDSLDEDYSFRVDYLTTLGAKVNDYLNRDSTFSLPQGLEESTTRQIAAPCAGSNMHPGREAMNTEARYRLLTGDRLVTPADIKIFCLKELTLRYGLDRDLIHRVSVGHRPMRDEIFKGYEVVVDIVLVNNPYVTKTLVPMFTHIETALEKMMEARTANIYPIRVQMMENGK